MTQNYVFMTENDINLLHNFQNTQEDNVRLYSRARQASQVSAGSGQRYSYTSKKLLFVRTIANIENEFVYKELLRSRAQFGSPMHFGI